MDLVKFPRAKGAQLTALRSLDPTEWAEHIRAALRRTGTIPDAAADLEVSTRTLQRWIADTPSLRVQGTRGPGRPWPKDGES